MKFTKILSKGIRNGVQSIYCNDIIITFSYAKDTDDTDRLISSFYE